MRLTTAVTNGVACGGLKPSFVTTLVVTIADLFTLRIDAYITKNLNLACKTHMRVLFEIIA